MKLLFAALGVTATVIGYIVVTRRREPVPAWRYPLADREDGLPSADPWPVALADPEFVRGIAEATAEHDAGEFRPFRHVVPMNEENTNNAPWYVASCGFAHPWGICHGHRYTLTGEAP